MYILADCHYGDITDSVLDLDTGLPSKLVDSLNRLREVIKKAAADKVSLIIAGDIFDSALPKPYVIDAVVSAFYRASSLGVKIYIIPGNHDCDMAWNSLAFLGSEFFTGTVTMVAKPEIHVVDTEPVLFAPHIPKKREHEIFLGMSYDAYLARILDSHKQGRVLLVSHGYVRGLVPPDSSEKVMESGNAITLHLQDKIFEKKLSGIVMGHVHASYMGLVGATGAIPFASPGSTIPHDFAEAENSKVAKSYVSYSNQQSPVFENIPFTSSMREYATAKINALKGPIDLDDEMLKKIAKFKNKITKLVIHCRDRNEVNEKALIEAFGTVARIEYVIKEKQGKSETVTSDDIFMHSLDHVELLRSFLSGREETDDIKKLAFDLGKEVVVECSSESV